MTFLVYFKGSHRVAIIAESGTEVKLLSRYGKPNINLYRVRS